MPPSTTFEVKECEDPNIASEMLVILDHIGSIFVEKNNIQITEKSWADGQKRVPLKDWVINGGTDWSIFSGGQMDRNTQAISKQIICRGPQKEKTFQEAYLDYMTTYDYLFSFIFSEVI